MLQTLWIIYILFAGKFKAKINVNISVLKNLFSSWFIFRKNCAYILYLNYQKGRTLKFCHGRQFAQIRHWLIYFQLKGYELKKQIYMISLMNLTVDMTIEGLSYTELIMISNSNVDCAGSVRIMLLIVYLSESFLVQSQCVFRL